tara:strand:- start:51766 stop:53100 length:1335 start_codon:yes stop_codon:yes gene_type:complete
MNHSVFQNKHFFLTFIAILFLSYGALRSARFGGPGSLVGFGCLPDDVCLAKLNAHIIPEDAPVFPTGGYDGQFYYYVAAAIYSGRPVISLADLESRSGDPAKADAKLYEEVGSPDSPVVVDSIGFRLSRIAFPLLAGWLYWLSPKALMLGMPALLLLSHLLASYLLFSFDRRAAWLFGVNPISLLSFGLNLAEPLALALACIASLIIMRSWANPGSGSTSTGALYGTAGLLLLLSMLGKETMFLVGGSMGLAALFRCYSRFRAAGAEAGRGAPWRCLRLPVILLLAGLLAIAWYGWTGFFAGDGAGGKVQVPFSGLMDFLGTKPKLISGRGLLVMGLLWMTVTLVALILHAKNSKSPKTPRNDSASPRSQRNVLLIAGLAGNLLLISFASAAEYWLNFANVARIFAPAMILFALVERQWLYYGSLIWVALLTALLWLNDLLPLV